MNRTEQETLFASALKFAYSIAWKFATATGLDGDDLCQVAAMALWHTCATFDPSKGADLCTYAKRDIRGRLIDHIAAGYKHGKGRVRSSEITENGAVELVDTLPAPVTCGTDRADVEVMIAAYLSPEEQAVIRGRYLQGKTGEAIGLELGITRQRVSQLEKAALLRLRELLIG